MALELIIINVATGAFILQSFYLIYRYKSTMASGAYHHLLSHLWIVIYGAISINLYACCDYIYPMIFVALHIIQHVVKENLRLVSTGRWTPSVKDI